METIRANRLLVEKLHENQKLEHLAFLDLEKAIDRVPLELIRGNYGGTGHKLKQENSGKYQDAFYVPGDSVDVPNKSATVPGGAVDLPNTSETVHGEP
ncbi:unnamed protein product [Heligmosomoides polygyrus]|uniref:Nas2_N domain-containing protein n=1 Tax=Heligmosomoides polygyrus TaxID=6339 RepID=A0A183GL28_HELPZ|nr:unnamed protein product [Heligmosomoides polygyrus]